MLVLHDTCVLTDNTAHVSHLFRSTEFDWTIQICTHFQLITGTILACSFPAKINPKILIGQTRYAHKLGSSQVQFCCQINSPGGAR